MKKERFSYLLGRLPMGLSFFGHGLIRITKLNIFSDGMVKQFEKSPLPVGLVSAFGHVLPFFEFITGILLLVGLFTRFSIILGSVIILALIFGSSMIEQWNAIFIQLFYGLYLAILYLFSDYNGFSIDALRNKQ